MKKIIQASFLAAIFSVASFGSYSDICEDFGEYIPMEMNWTKAHYAAEGGANKVLLNATLDELLKLDEKGRSPLHIAMIYQDENYVREILEGLKDKYSQSTHFSKIIEASGYDGQPNGNVGSLLFEAAFLGYQSVVYFLLENGAAVNVSVNRYGQTPLHAAVMGGNVEIVKMIVEKLIELTGNNGIENGLDLLSIAVKENRENVFDYLLNLVPNFRTGKNRFGQTLLHVAAANGNKVFLEKLLRKNVSVNALDLDNLTPLCVAAKNGQPEIMETLLKANCGVTLNLVPFTAFNVAVDNAQEGAANFLIDYVKERNIPVDVNALIESVKRKRRSVPRRSQAIYDRILEKLSSIDPRSQDPQTCNIF